MSTIMPRSALRHRPITQDIPEFVVLSPPLGHQQPLPRAQARNQHPLVLIGLSMLLTFLFLWAIGSIASWGSMQLDTLRYGYPRIVQLDHAVGHAGGNSHFTAWNLGGQIYVLELPAGNPSASHLLVGPRLIGPGADLATVQLAFAGDPKHPDLLIEVQEIAMRFSNTGSAYLPAAASS